MRIIKFNPSTQVGLRKLERQLDRVAEKHDIEEPLRFMPSPDTLFDFEDEEYDDE